LRAPPLLLLAVVGCSSDGVPPPIPRWDVPAERPDVDPLQVDRIVQVTPAQIDVLWVLGDHASMAPHHQTLSEQLPSFLDFFVGSGLDLHLGVTSTDISPDGPAGALVEVAGQRFLDADTADPVALFAAMVALLGTDGTAAGQGFAATVLALEVGPDSVNPGFRREGAAIHTIVVSDRPDASETMTSAEFAGWYAGLAEHPAERTFSSIVDPVEGDDYLAVTNQVGGGQSDLRDEDWSPALETIGIGAAGLRREFFLSRTPLAETLRVEVEDPDGSTLADLEVAYDAGRNSVRFVEYVPSPLATVVLSYTVR
jgi:hypothetical protein